MKSKIVLTALSIALTGSLCAETVTLRPIADTSLFETSPDNNFGASDSFQTGVNAQGFAGRGLFKFDIAGQIPPGAEITSAQVSFRVTASSGAPAADHTLTRVALDWNEGNKTGRQGAAADAGETTWDARRHDQQQWTTPGGDAGSDFAQQTSATTSFDGIGDYTFASTPELVEDVQQWLDGTTPNSGWMLRARSENDTTGSRRVATREDAEFAPTLTIEFAPMQINSIQVAESIDLSWQGGQAPFDLEATTDPAGDWLPLATGLETSTTSVTPTEGERFFRIRTSPAPKTTRYRVTWRATWTDTNHPTSFPSSAHFSQLYGATHDASVSFWEPGGLATPGIERMAETGSTSGLRGEITTAIGSERILSGVGLGASGRAPLDFDISQDNSLVTLVSMIAPSPDWFIGIHGVDLFRDGQWVENLTLTLPAYDAGTDSGTTYTSSNAATSPAEPITQITPLGDTRPFGTFTFERIPPQ